MASQEIREIERTIPFPLNGNASLDGGMAFSVLQWIGANSGMCPPYWSVARDIYLRQFYLRSDYLKIATRTFVQKAYATPLTIAPRDHTVKAHSAMAGQIYNDLMRNSGLLRGFHNEFSKFATDYTTQDNGAFMLVMGPGKADGPITGQVSGLVHLDSQRCTRTGHPEFPVVYTHVDGKRYRLHYTRVILMSSMPSGNADLYDVGVCAVSACMDSAQDMLDVSTYNSEKFGSRPARQILYVKTGATLKQLSDAALHANTKMDAQGLSHFSRTMLLAPQSVGGVLELDVIDLLKAPDGFDRQQATVLDVAAISAAYGLDPRDLSHSFGLSGQTKADAEVMHLKTNDKGVSRFLSDFAEQLNQKVLPDVLESYFDYVDDTQDEQAATIRKLRAEGRNIDLTSGATTIRTVREQMVEDGEITENQFEDMELVDGRLADGLDVLMLFQSQDGEIRRILMDIDPALAVDEALVEERRRLAWERHDAAPNANIKRKMRQALAALAQLQAQSAQTQAQSAQTQAQQTEPATLPEPEPDEQPADDEDAPETPTEGAEQTDDETVKAKVKPAGAGRALPAIPDDDDLADEAEENADEALASWDAAVPEYAGLLDASVGKKKGIKASDRFSYDERSFRYRDGKTGRFVSEDTVRQLTEQYQAARKEVGPALANRLANGEISVQQWVNEMRGEIRNSFSAEYMAGRGGRNMMTPADWGKIGSMTGNQYGFLNDFAKEVAAGNLSEAQIAARSNLYLGSARQAYERGKVAAHGMPDLPAVPGDGGTPCNGNCKCTWSISETKTAWTCRWVLSDAEHCDGCIDRAAQWNPLVIPKEG